MKSGYLEKSGDYCCAECGAQFYIRNPQDYAWKMDSVLGQKWFCRYTHMTHWRERYRAQSKENAIAAAGRKGR